MRRLHTIDAALQSISHERVPQILRATARMSYTVAHAQHPGCARCTGSACISSVTRPRRLITRLAQERKRQRFSRPLLNLSPQADPCQLWFGHCFQAPEAPMPPPTPACSKKLLSVRPTAMLSSTVPSAANVHARAKVEVATMDLWSFLPPCRYVAKPRCHRLNAAYIASASLVRLAPT